MREDTLQLLVLTVFLLIYMLIGAGIFTALELQNENRLKALYDNIFHSFAKDHNLTDSSVAKLLSTHKQACLLGVGLDKINRWDYIGSFYFTGTVLTTIGFGLTAPSTFAGQLFFIFYAMIGIPINILFMNTALQRSVTTLSYLVRKGYDHMPKIKFFTPPGPKELPLGEMLIVSFVIFFLISLLLAMAFALIEGWSFFEAIYFIIVACSTVGFGDYVPSKTRTSVEHNMQGVYRVLNWFLIAIGLVLLYVVLNLEANFFKNLLAYCIQLCKKYACPCLNIQVEPLDPSTSRTRGSAAASRGRVSRLSVVSDGEGQDLGSFAAIQVALDRLKTQAECNALTNSTELTALTNIEKLLKAEYFRVRGRQGNTTKARWKRAAQKARLLRQQQKDARPVVSSIRNGNVSSARGIENNNKHLQSYEDLPGAIIHGE